MNLPIASNAIKKFNIEKVSKKLGEPLKRILFYKISLPEIKLPTFNLPEFNPPQFNPPKLNIPKFRFNLPKITLPAINFLLQSRILICRTKFKFNLSRFNLLKLRTKIQTPRINFPKFEIKMPKVNMPKFNFDFKRISNSSQIVSLEFGDRLFTIGETAKAVGVSISTIRRWDREGKIKIGRKQNGYRAFTQAEIEILRQSQAPSGAWQTQIPSNIASIVQKNPVKPYLTLSKLILSKSLKAPLIKITSSPFLLKTLTVLILVSVVVFYSGGIQWGLKKGNQVLGVETFIAPSLGEGGLLNNVFSLFGKTAEKTGSLLKGGRSGGFVVPFVGENLPAGRQGEPTAVEDLKVTGKAIFAKDLEGLKDLRIKGTAFVGKLKTDIVDPYLIENEGTVQSSLEIRTLPSSLGSADIVFTPGGIEQFRLKEGGDVKFNGNVSGINSLTTSSITTSKFNITGDFSITGTLNGNTLSSTKLVFSGSSPSIYPSTSNTSISLNASGTGAINIGSSGTGDVYIAGGSSDSGCTITNSNGTLNCSGNITSQADIDIRGGDLTTNVTTFNLINTTATTLNIGGASTTISIGASTGTTTINNALTVTGVLTASSTFSATGDVTLTGDLAVNGGDITTTSATFNLVNAATTLNLGSTAVTRTINIGTGTNVDTINLGTGATGVDVISIGSSVASLALTDADWSITTAGLITTASDLAVNGGDITTTATTLNIDVGNTGSILFRDGTNTLLTIADGGTVGNVTVSGTLISSGAFTASAGLTLSTGALSLTGTSGSIALTGFGTTAITSTTTSGDILGVTDTSLTAASSNLANFTFKNNNTGAGIAVSGITVTEQAAGTPSSGTNTSNLLNLSAAAGGTVNGINISSATGFTNFIKTPSAVLDSSGNLSGVVTLTATTLAGTLSTAAQASVTSVGTLTSLAVTGNINSSTGSLQTNGVTRVDNSGNVTAGTGSFGGAVNPSLDATYDLGTAVLRWNNAFFAGDVTAGDLVFKNNFRFTENGDKGINILNPKGEVIGGFDDQGNLWMKGEIKQHGTGN